MGGLLPWSALATPFQADWSLSAFFQAIIFGMTGDFDQPNFYRSHFPWLCLWSLTKGKIFLSSAWQPQVSQFLLPYFLHLVFLIWGAAVFIGSHELPMWCACVYTCILKACEDSFWPSLNEECPVKEQRALRAGSERTGRMRGCNARCRGVWALDSGSPRGFYNEAGLVFTKAGGVSLLQNTSMKFWILMDTHLLQCDLFHGNNCFSFKIKLFARYTSDLN